MKILKYLSKKIYIPLIICILIICTNEFAGAITITSNQSFAKAGHSVSFLTVVQVSLNGTGSPATLQVFINYGDGTSEVQVYNQEIGQFNIININSDHVFSNQGNYLVKARAVITAPSTIIAPNPGTMIQQVGMLDISRIRLYFENNRPEITLNMNQKAPDLFVKIDYSGSGYFKGYWEIDGRRHAHVFKHLSRGPSITLKYPGIPPIPTYHFGTHKVRFIITSPEMPIDFPHGVYFVTSDRKYDKSVIISLIHPSEGETIAYDSLIFKWKPVKKSPLYLLSIFSKSKKQRIFSAYTVHGRYKLQLSAINMHMHPGEEYLWNVVGFDDQNNITAESMPSAFFFNQKTVFLPGQILFMTKATERGDRVIQKVKTKYGFEILETYFIKTLGIKVTKFFTDKEILGIINELKKYKGALAVQPNYIFSTMSGKTDEPLNEFQSIRKIIKLGSDIPFKGKGVTIGIIDTGVDLNHKDLKSAIFSHANCFTHEKYKSEIHGTAVAGLIGARRNDFGIDGYAPESMIFAIRACKQISKTQPRGECYSASISKALDLAIQNKVQIINMSLGTNIKDQLISKLIDSGSKQGIIFVAPAGNNTAITRLCFPASHPNVISVAGITDQGNFFPNKEVADQSDFYLPCNNLFSTIPDNKHNFLSGTSLSGAVVSGLLALSYEKNKDYITKNIKTFDGDMNKWINNYLRSKNIVTQENH